MRIRSSGKNTHRAAAPRRVVIKFGTGILTRPETGRLDAAQIRRLADEVAELVLSGRQCVIVSSGAVGAGLPAMGFDSRPNDLTAKQACAAVGQSLLMRGYQNAFLRRGLHAAQILLTHQDLDSRKRRANAQATLERLLATGRIVPVINENDVVAVEELRFGDNDELSAEVAVLASADLLVILTSVDGLYETLPSGATRLVTEIRDFRAALALIKNETGILSTGGMRTKILAAQKAAESGIRVVIANGRRPGSILAAWEGGAPFTDVPPLLAREKATTSK